MTVFDASVNIGLLNSLKCHYSPWQQDVQRTMHCLCRGGGAFSNVGQRGAHLPLREIRIPLLRFFKIPFALFFGTSKPLFTVSSVSVIDLWLGSSWVVWGWNLCALKSPTSQVLSNTNVLFEGGHYRPPSPPALPLMLCRSFKMKPSQIT